MCSETERKRASRAAAAEHTTKLPKFTCAICGPSKPAARKQTVFGEPLCRTCLRDLDWDAWWALEQSSHKTEEPPRHRCFSCFSHSSALHVVPCQALNSCEGVTRLCQECMTARDVVPCPRCWASEKQGCCFQCGGGLDHSERLLSRLCQTCATQRFADSGCYGCGSTDPATTYMRQCGQQGCDRQVLLCDTCVSCVETISCRRCASAWQGKCYMCRAAGQQKAKVWGRICKTCYHWAPANQGVLKCFYCNSDEGAVEERVCTRQGEDCKRKVVMCKACRDLHDDVICSRCWSREFSLGCFKCRDKWARQSEMFGRFCKNCYHLFCPDGQKHALLEEAAAYLEERNATHLTISGKEPALQLLLLPLHDGVAHQLPRYNEKAVFLSPLHCRLCLQDLEQDPTGSVSYGSDRVAAPVFLGGACGSGSNARDSPLLREDSGLEEQTLPGF